MSKQQPDTYFWEELDAGRLMLQVCSSCGTPRFYPRPLCPECYGTEATWKGSEGVGTVYGVTTVRRSIPSAPFDPPYQVALVDLEDGVRMFGNASEGHLLNVNDRVKARIVPREGERPIILFDAVGDLST